MFVKEAVLLYLLSKLYYLLIETQQSFLISILNKRLKLSLPFFLQIITYQFPSELNLITIPAQPHQLILKLIDLIISFNYFLILSIILTIRI